MLLQRATVSPHFIIREATFLIHRLSFVATGPGQSHIASSRLKWNYNEITTSSQAEIDVLYLQQEILTCALLPFISIFMREMRDK